MLSNILVSICDLRPVMTEWRVFFDVTHQLYQAQCERDAPSNMRSFDIWKHLGINTGGFLRAAPEERTDAYILIPDVRFGIKLRGGKILEMKVCNLPSVL